MGSRNRKCKIESSEDKQLESVEQNLAGNGFCKEECQETTFHDVNANLLEQPSQRGRDETRGRQKNQTHQHQPTRSKSLASFKTVLSKTSVTVRNLISRNK